MAMIHQTLYQSQNFSQIDFSEYLRRFTTDLLQSYRVDPAALSVKIEAEQVPLPLDAAVPLGLIVNELLSNAIKHAFPKGRNGEIVVQLSALNSGGWTLAVADNGCRHARDVVLLDDGIE